MNDREKQILKILRRNPLIQQNEIADILQISRSRVAAHIMDLMRKGLIKGKGYILTEQDYCVVVGVHGLELSVRSQVNLDRNHGIPYHVQYLTRSKKQNVTC